MNIMLELGLILAICLAGEWIAALLPCAFPASVISMVLLMLLLLTGIVKERMIQSVSKFLVVNMGLFFVPALVGTLQYVDVLKSQLFPFFIVTFLTTPLVYLAAAWSVQALMKLLVRKEDKKHA